jgi:hypothetical protein
LLTISGGRYTQEDATGNTIDDITAVGNCYIVLNHAGNLANINATGSGSGASPTIDCSQTSLAKTVAATKIAKFRGGAALLDPDEILSVVTAGNLTFDRASLLASDLGPEFSLVRG